ncbi:hypothetical protein [Deinococcus soli (ex Cha et al. 2016)]|uniref:Uncharacterized protein n=2 Tax=Deinococcus soli (ex Cha et al. 2016) TaxID=1309411 RepID=A0ACC6KKL1_9DEIO|nr:hypothetical protein [Deinococcus soli (ex Cha et al. 2016)]MDR6218637.1 hypothetical protein [Deinococcus soli (ex Cha et al. 2016)]MDR6328434.1 hypothetical protein [Deinococcus soli (ex Cha et al. 2016)]MDR6753045.1 hypothetical protein [Deinococcus soli (ex Cha et al. 2016)]
MNKDPKWVALVKGGLNVAGEDDTGRPEIVAIGEASVVAHAAGVLGGSHRAAPLPVLASMTDVELTPEYRVAVHLRLIGEEPAFRTTTDTTQVLRALRSPEGVWRQLWLDEATPRPGPMVWALSHESGDAAQAALTGVMRAAPPTGALWEAIAPLAQDLPAGHYREGLVSGVYEEQVDEWNQRTPTRLDVQGARAMICRDVSGQRLELFVALPEEDGAGGWLTQTYWAGLDAELEALRRGATFAYDGCVLTVTACTAAGEARPMAWAADDGRGGWYPAAHSALSLR